MSLPARINDSTGTPGIIVADKIIEGTSNDGEYGKLITTKTLSIT